MIDFKDYANKIQEMFNIDDPLFREKLTHLLVDNDWFEIIPVFENNILYVEPAEFQHVLPIIEEFFALEKLETSAKSEYLIEKLSNRLPDTSRKLNEFYHQLDVPLESRNNITGFIIAYLKKDICLMNDEEIQSFLKDIFNELPKQYGDLLTIFFSWLKEHYKTRYMHDYTMLNRQEPSDNTAYDLDEYLQLLFYLFNDDYIEDYEMYDKAAESKNFIDTWLFLSLHFICALRNTDIIRIQHPRLTMEPEQVLEQVKERTFSEEDARLTLYSITWRLNALPLTPNKTQKHNHISSIKLCIPESIEVHMGTLFALAEAHHQLNNIPQEEPLIRVITDYNRISRYMGDEIGLLFLESDFRTRAANKSYLQSIYMLTDDILENDDEFNVKGYILAAIARSHKGSYGEFATTTATYLKDAKLSGLTPEFVARELFERGVLSFIPSMLLKIITNGEFNKLSVSKQTQLIQELNLTPNEIDNAVAVTNKSKRQSVEIVKEILASTDKADRRRNILLILHRIGNANAVSKQDECLCLMSAMKKICPYNDRSCCIGCKYEISTKSTIFLMVSEYKRLSQLYKQTSDERLKLKYKTLIQTTILPVMDELLQCVHEQYGPEALETLENIIKEYT